MNEKIKEYLASSSPEMRELGRALHIEQQTRTRIGLDVVKRLQIENPYLIVGGSIALYLYGVRLDRMTTNYYKGDIDVIMPFYVPIKGGDGGILPLYKKLGSSDFDYSVSCGSKIIDICIDNKILYNEIEIDDFKYKVALLEDILAAKAKYCGISNDPDKHRSDIYEMLSVKDPNKVKPTGHFSTPWSAGS